MRLGDWELVSLEAVGILSRICRARPAGCAASRPAAYAVKLLREPWNHQPTAIDMLRREAFVGRKVTHPHVVAVLEAHVEEPPFYLVMPWLEGRHLGQLMGEALPALPAALWYVRQAAEGLDALHSAGWMHADVKPANILVSPSGHVTLIDLGFARRADEVGWLADRYVAGTPYYLAPETFTSSLRADIRSDLYSLGVVLFELLTGQRPFAGPSLADLVVQHRQAAPPDVRRLAPHVPDDVARLVRQLMAKDPLRRPQRPQELVERLVELEVETFGSRNAKAEGGGRRAELPIFGLSGAPQLSTPLST
jgi:serine/threonine-protein kinase